MSEKHWKILWANVTLAARYGRGGGRGLKEPKYPNKTRSGNQDEQRHEITFTLDYLKYMWKIQDGKCYWLGIDMSLEDLMISHSPFAVSVDRVNSKFDYHEGNVVLTTRFANRGRGAYDNYDFTERINDLFIAKDADFNRDEIDERLKLYKPQIPVKLYE